MRALQVLERRRVKLVENADGVDQPPGTTVEDAPGNRLAVEMLTAPDTEARTREENPDLDATKQVPRVHSVTRETYQRYGVQEVWHLVPARISKTGASQHLVLVECLDPAFEAAFVAAKTHLPSVWRQDVDGAPAFTLQATTIDQHDCFRYVNAEWVGGAQRSEADIDAEAEQAAQDLAYEQEEAEALEAEEAEARQKAEDEADALRVEADRAAEDAERAKLEADVNTADAAAKTDDAHDLTDGDDQASAEASE